MGENGGKPSGVDLVELLLELRDVGLDSWAKIVLGITGSDPYMRASSALAKPGLVAAAAARLGADAAMSRLLARVNMPSRADVLALSVRLTHIEMALDDLSAAVDDLRAAVARRTPGAKEAPNAGSARPRRAATRGGR